MKKTIAIVCCLLWTAAFAQNIPADSLDTYRKEAHRMLIAGDTAGAVDFYKQLALSGDALSGYLLYELYSEGKGVPKDEHEAAKWLIPSALHSVRWLPADEEIIQDLSNMSI